MDMSMKIRIDDQIIQIDKLGTGNKRRYFQPVKTIPLEELVWEIPEDEFQMKKRKIEQYQDNNKAVAQNSTTNDLQIQNMFQNKKKTESISNQLIENQLVATNSSQKKQHQKPVEKTTFDSKIKVGKKLISKQKLQTIF
eukprot:TRINITY_DN5043_c0_g2_i1.p2 TRINITY_DN5043_c0_g2~~TRINITY_DN5043_c0_g2_i1.p2  ORF type:complete len:151 (-),score=21.20 TRINITY_DN5043_c0_g2_i1:301-717(-)